MNTQQLHSTLWLIVWSFCMTMPLFSQDAFSVSIQGDSILCPGDSATLIAVPNMDAEFIWSNGATDSAIVVTEANLFSVIVINEMGDSASAFVTVGTLDFPEVNIFVSGKLECPNDNVNLSVPFSVTTDYMWSTSQTNNVISVGNPGTYWVQAINECGIATDTAVVESDNKPYPEANILVDSTDICEGDSTILKLEINSEGFWFWSTGFAFVDSIVIDTPGTYWVEFINDCGAVTEFIDITRPPEINVQIDGPSEMCQGEEVELLANANTAIAYRWSDASTDMSFVTASTGTYRVSVTDKCGDMAMAEQFVQEIPPPIVLLNVEEALLCEEDHVQVRADTAWTDEVIWSTGDTSIAIFPSDPGDYNLIATNRCFETFASTFVNTMRVPVFVPNAFSPNNDGNNDFFLPHLECQNVENYELQIYSRWGDPVFNTNDYTEWWDGKKAGNNSMPTGVYVWFMKFKIRERNYYFDGDVLLIR
jgi:gliding motility-associated-like protein